MKVLAIVAEYNPMHLGHIYQIKKLKENFQNSRIIVLMSGHFVQRGGVSIFDKWTRAKIAVENGADLVIQIPEFFSSQVAEIFAYSSSKLIDNLGIVNYQCFSTENYTASELESIKQNIKDREKEVDLFTRRNLSLGYSYPMAYSLAKEHLKIPSIKKSNDILAYEYVKALDRLKSKVKPYSIKRVGDSYNSQIVKTFYPSATSIRREIDNGSIEKALRYMAGNLKSDLVKREAKFDQDFFDLIKYSLTLKNENKSLKEIFEVSEGIDIRIGKVLPHVESLQELVANTKSKRYTFNKIKRILFNSLLDIKKEDIERLRFMDFLIPYIRILAFNKDGRELLARIKKASTLPIINKVANFEPRDDYSKTVFEKDILASRIYNLIKKSYYYDDFLTSPKYI